MRRGEGVGGGTGVGSGVVERGPNDVVRDSEVRVVGWGVGQDGRGRGWDLGRRIVG